MAAKFFFIEYKEEKYQQYGAAVSRVVMLY